MFLKLLSIEWTCLSRRATLWLLLAFCTLYTAGGLSNFYRSSQSRLLDGTLKMPGISFDLANALDQLNVLIPFLVILAANLMGSDYTQRTNRHWLMRAPRQTSLLAKFTLLVAVTLGIQVTTMLTGWAVGAYFKACVYHVANANNLDGLATLLAPLYMTLAYLPYIALALLLAVGLRSTFFSVALGLGYTLFIEFFLAGVSYGQNWTKWLLLNLHFSATFLLNSIGNRYMNFPEHILAPGMALAMATLYTSCLLVVAICLYRRQDVGG